MKLEDLFSQLKNCQKRSLTVRDTIFFRGILDVLCQQGRLRFYQKLSGGFLRIYLKKDVVLPYKAKSFQLNNAILTTSSLPHISTAKKAAHIGGVILARYDI